MAKVITVAKKIEGKVVAVDAAGNLLTDITAEQFEGMPHDERCTIMCNEHETHGLYSMDHNQPEMTFLGILAEEGKLQLTIVDENAHLMLGIQVNDLVVIQST